MALKISNTDPGTHFKKGKNTYKTEKYVQENAKEVVTKEKPKKAK